MNWLDRLKKDRNAVGKEQTDTDALLVESDDDVQQVADVAATHPQMSLADSVDETLRLARDWADVHSKVGVLFPYDVSHTPYAGDRWLEFAYLLGSKAGDYGLISLNFDGNNANFVRTE